jgi:hypothetical protein
MAEKSEVNDDAEMLAVAAVVPGVAVVPVVELFDDLLQPQQRLV